MKIRGAKKDDFESYLLLKREEEKDLTSYLKQEIVYPEDKILKKEFLEVLKDRKQVLIVALISDNLVGYLHGSFFKNIYSSGGYIEDIFISKDFRKKGFAKGLINIFEREIKKRGYKKIQLSVNSKNKKAIKLYNQLGFELYHYDFRKELK